MHLIAIYENNRQPRLDELREETNGLRPKANEAETRLELEYYPLLEELQVKFEAQNQRP